MPVGTASTDLPAVAAFEKEFPGASWMSARVFRELEEVGGLAETLVASVARRHSLSHAALNALAIIEGTRGTNADGNRRRTDAHHDRHHDQRARHPRTQRIRRAPAGPRRPPSSPRRHNPPAQAVLDGLLPEVVQTTTAALAGFSWELDDFLDTLGRVRHTIAAVPNDLGPPAPSPDTTKSQTFMSEAGLSGNHP